MLCDMSLADADCQSGCARCVEGINPGCLECLPGYYFEEVDSPTGRCLGEITVCLCSSCLGYIKGHKVQYTIISYVCSVKYRSDETY